MASGQEAVEVAGKKKLRGGKGGGGYDRGFRVTAPPLPLWVAGKSSLLLVLASFSKIFGWSLCADLLLPDLCPRHDVGASDLLSVGSYEVCRLLHA